MQKREIINILFRPIKENSTLFLLYIAISIYLLFHNVYVSPWPRLFYPVFDSYLVCVVSSLLRRIKLGWLFSSAILIIVIGEVFCLFFYESPFSIRVIQLIAESNVSESTEFLHALFTKDGIGTVILLIFSFVFCSYLFAKIVAWIFGKASSSKLCLIGKALIILFVAWTVKFEFPTYKLLRRACLATETIQMANLYPENGYLTPLTRFAFGVIYNKIATEEISILIDEQKRCEVLGCENRCPLIVLIIGESFSKYHTPLYQPDVLNTNPRLLKLQADSALVTYSNIISPSNITSKVMQQLFSLRQEDDETGWVHYPLFTTAFRKAGYNVFLRTNQFQLKDNDDFNQMGGTIFNNPELSSLQFTDRNDSLYQFDGSLIQTLPDTATLSAKPTLLIVHLMGQHYKYDMRYPSDRNHFTPDSIIPFSDNIYAKTIPAAYANATLYNDSVIDAIWRKVNDLDAICLYFSDHGEECYDWRNFCLRSDENEMSPEIAKYQFEVPFMFFLSDRFRTNHPNLTHQIWSARNKPGMNSDASQILLYLAGIDIREYRPDRNILLPEYDTSRKRRIGGHTDYDKIIKRLKPAR